MRAIIEMLVTDPPPRSIVRTVPCPYCNAPASQQCVGARGKRRESNHMERVRAYEGRS